MMTIPLGKQGRTHSPKEICAPLQALSFAARKVPDRTAIICGEEQLTYEEYALCVQGLGDLLSQKTVAGERIVIAMANSIELSIIIYAAWLAQAAVVLVNPTYTERELAELIAGAKGKLVICDANITDKLRQPAHAAGISEMIEVEREAGNYLEWMDRANKSVFAPNVDLNAPAALLFTGGTTGLPKAALHSHEEFAHTMKQIHALWPSTPERDIWLNVAPQSHIFGFCMSCLLPVFTRNTLVLLPKFHPEIMLNAIAKNKVTIFAGGPPSIYHALLHFSSFEDTDLSSLRFCLGGGASFAPEFIKQWKAATGVTIHEGYGMSEGSPIALVPYERTDKAGSVGIAPPETYIEIVDLENGQTVLAQGECGEVRVRGPQMMKTYWSAKESDSDAVHDGWIYTGDIGYFDDEGFLYLVDRKKDIVIVGGFNVFPSEIDDVLYTHENIQEAAAVGIADDYKGETIHAFIVPKGKTNLNPEEVIEFCQKRLAPYKVPTQVHVLSSIPKTGAEKIDKHALRNSLTSPKRN